MIRLQFNKMTFNSLLCGLLTAGVLGAGMASATSLVDAADTEQKGLAIAKEIDRRDQGFGDTSSRLVMVLSNAYGEKSERKLRTRILEKEQEGDKSLIIFDNPRDVKGTAFLSFTYKVGPDKQWLYLPALKRVKRISSTNKSGPFVGSEFAYEDISSQEVEKYTYNYLRDENMDGRDHYVIERDPVDPNSGYSRQEVWVDKEYYRISKIDFYDRGKSLIKTLVYSDYKLHLKKYWRANHWFMSNHKTNKKTKLLFDEWVFRNGYTDNDFTKTRLSQLR